ncbi:hypothetical protein LCGC14_1501850, partial [marine sediment metagenome]
TITITNLIVNWDDTDATDFLDLILASSHLHDSTTTNNLITAGTNLGVGTTGFRNDAANITDFAMRTGDWVFLLVRFSQATGQSCRVYSIQADYTIA